MIQKSLIFALFTLFASNLFAQVGSEEVKVVAPYEPTISDAYKINETPQIIETTEVKAPELEYTVFPEQLKTTFELEPIRPARMVGEPLSKLYNSYIKAGFGNYTTPYGELFYHNLRSKRHSYGAHLKHISSSGDITDNETDIDFVGNNSFTGANIFGRKFYEKYTLAGNIDYQRKGVYFYGYDVDKFPNLTEQLDKDSIKQIFNYIGAEANFFSNNTDTNKIEHNSKLNFYNLSDDYEAKETKIGIYNYFAKDIRIIDYDMEQVRLDVDVDIYSNSNKLYDHTNALVRLNPRYTAIFKDFTFNIGTNAMVTADSVSDLYFYPDIDLDVGLVQKILVVYAGLNGSAKRHNFYDFTAENPYIISEIPVGYSLEKFNLSAGLKGSISSHFSYNIGFESSEVENMPFFINDTSSNRFTIVYDDIELLNIKAHFASQVREKIKMLLAFDYYDYKMTNEAKAWHKPSMELAFGFQYQLKEKFLLNLDIISYGERYAKTYNLVNGKMEEKKLLGAVDMNLGLDYRYSKVLSFFLKLHNIEGVSHYKWNNYPSQKFNILGGVTYAF